MRRCEEHQQDLVAFVRRELPALEHARLAAHLEHCTACAAVEATLRKGLDDARAWRPDAERAHVDRLVGRLGPYVEASRAPRASRWMGAALVAGGLAAFAALVISFTLVGGEGSKPHTDERIVAGITDAIAGTARHELTPHLRAIATAEWAGDLERTVPSDTVLSMETGLAVLAFEGGEGRKLTVVAPGLAVDVIGTKFFVDATRVGLTTVGVLSGRVRVRAPSGDVLVEAGETHAWSTGGALVEPPLGSVQIAAAIEADPFLDRHGHSEPSPTPTAEPAALDAELARAEALADSGRAREAVAIHDELLGRQALGTTERALVRYQKARLLAFELHEAEQAKRELRALASSSGPFAVEAELALCELLLATSPCDARICLTAFAGRTRDSQAAAEALGLVARWGLTEKVCAR